MRQIPLTKGLLAIVDDADFAALSRYQWHASGVVRQYAVRRGRSGEPKAVAMHRVITDAPDGFDVDHLNGNGLDNRRANLRICTRSANIGNATPKRKNNRTGFKGVSWRPDKMKFAAQIKVNRKTRHLGFFATAQEASAAYLAAANAAFFAK